MSIGLSSIFQRKVIILKYLIPFPPKHPRTSSHYKWTLVKYIILVKIMITSELDPLKNTQKFHHDRLSEAHVMI